jgi:hypothetical protein
VRFSKPFAPLPGSHKEFLIDDVWRGRPLCDKGELELLDDAIGQRTDCEEGDDAHLALALGESDWVQFIDFPDYVCPAAAGDPRAFLLDNKEIMNQETGQSPQEKVNR